MQATPAAKRRVVISTTCEADSSVAVGVRDYGSGLPKKIWTKVFTHFYYSTKPNVDGNGFDGCSLYYRSAWREVAAENVDVGARFFFTLPVTRKS